MSEENDLNNDDRNTFVGEFPHTPLYRHIWIALLEYWKRGAASASTVLVILFGVIGFGFERLDIELSKNAIITLLLSATSMTAIIIIAVSYFNHVPNGFEDETREMRQIAHFKKIKWQYRLALGLLKEKLGKIEQEINDVIDSRKYVPITSLPEIDEYVSWLPLRSSNLLGMISVAKELLLRDLADAMSNNGLDMPDPAKILRSVNRVKNLYESTYDFGVIGRSIQAPDGFERVHEIQASWVESIKDAILQVYEFLETILKWDTKTESEMEFVFTFEPPSNLDEFLDEINRLKGNT